MTASGSSDAGVLLELAERCEKADAADRGLDADIHVALGLANYTGNDLHMRGAVAVPGENYWQQAPYYSSSIDAAMTLRPDGANYFGFDQEADGSCEAYWSRNKVKSGHWIKVGNARTPALALCAAALRAKAALVTEKEPQV